MATTWLWKHFVKAIKPTFIHAWFNSYVGVVLDLKWKGKGREKDHKVMVSVPLMFTIKLGNYEKQLGFIEIC